MISNYSRGTGDLEIFLEDREDEILGFKQIKGELMEYGYSLGKDLILKRNPKTEGELAVNRIRKDTEGGWNSITAFEVLLSDDAYARLRNNKKVSLRDGSNPVEIYASVTRKGATIFHEGKPIYRIG